MKDFDYIIIGGGCAGLSLAYELEIHKKLFSETGGFIIEVQPKNIQSIIDQFKKYKLDIIKLGTTNKSNQTIINDSINKPINELKNAWQNGLRDKL